jgi:hypothetical protein
LYCDEEKSTGKNGYVKKLYIPRRRLYYKGGMRADGRRGLSAVRMYLREKLLCFGL